MTARKTRAATVTTPAAAPKPLTSGQVKSLQRILVGKIVDALTKYEGIRRRNQYQTVSAIPLKVYGEYLATLTGVVEVSGIMYEGDDTIHYNRPGMYVDDAEKLVAFAKSKGVKVNDLKGSTTPVRYNPPAAFNNMANFRNPLYAPMSQHAAITAQFKAIEEIELAAILTGDVEKSFRAIEAAISKL